MKRKRWDDFTTTEKTGIIAGAAVQLGLLAAALWDLAHKDASEVRGDKRVWTGLVFVNWIGPLAYFAVGRKGALGSLPCCKAWFGGRSDDSDDETAD